MREKTTIDCGLNTHMQEPGRERQTEQKVSSHVKVLVKIPTNEKAQKQESGANERLGIESIWCQSVMLWFTYN